jgi:opacity protein-like surface antigen
VVVVPPVPPKPVRGLDYSFHLGMNFPAGKFSEEYDPGPSLTFDVEYSLRDNLSILGLLGFHYFHSNENDLSWTNLSLNARFYFPLVGWRWYVSGGPGSYMPNNGSRKFGMNLGTGLNFPIQPNLSLDVGADYHLVDPSGDRRVFFDVKMGLVFKF